MGYPGKEVNNEDESPELAKKSKINYRVEAELYIIDEMKYSTMKKDLDRLREVYDIPNDVDLRAPSPKDTFNCPLRRYVIFYLECFTFGISPPLQFYFVRVLAKMNLAPG